MNESLKKQITFGSLTVVAIGIAAAPAWSPPVGDENVIIPSGQHVSAGEWIESKTPADPANVLGPTPTIVVGNSNDNYRTGSVADAGRGLIVGNSNKLSTRLSNGYSAVVGNFNDVRGIGTLVAGASNQVCKDSTAISGYYGPARSSLISGTSNMIKGGSDSVVVGGKFSTVAADNSLVIGQSNTVEGSTLDSKASGSAVIGNTNHLMATVGWVVGSSNELSGIGASAFGVGLIADSFCSVFVGEYNEASLGDLDSREADDPVFVVGNGTDAVNRSNALVVKRNGDVIITKPQGDISMGNYGN